MASEPSAFAAAPAESPDDDDSFASVETLVHRLRKSHRTAAYSRPEPAVPAARETTPSDRLLVARGLLAAGDPFRARPLLEAAAAQLVLRPVTPENSPPDLGPRPAAERVNVALRWLDAGQPARALSLVDAAIAALDPPRAAPTPYPDRRFAAEAPALGPPGLGLW